MLCFCCPVFLHFHCTENIHSYTLRHTHTHLEISFSLGELQQQWLTRPPPRVFISSKWVWCVKLVEEEDRSRLWTPERTGDAVTFLCPITGTFPPYPTLSSVCLTSTFPVCPSISHFFPGLSLSLSDRYFLFSLLLTSQKRTLTDLLLTSVMFGVELCVYVALSWAERDPHPSGLWNLGRNLRRKTQKAFELMGTLSELQNRCLFEVWRFEKKLHRPSVQTFNMVDWGLWLRANTHTRTRTRTHTHTHTHTHCSVLLSFVKSKKINWMMTSSQIGFCEN